MADAYNMEIFFEKSEEHWLVAKTKISGTRHIRDF